MKQCDAYTLLLKDDHCLTITDMRQKIAGRFSYEDSEATIVCALLTYDAKSLHAETLRASK